MTGTSDATAKGLTEAEQEKFERLVRSFCDHLVGLTVTYSSKSNDDPNALPYVALYAGTIIAIEGVVFYLTAGHCLRKIMELKEKTEIEAIRLIDTLGSSAIDRTNPIPFHLDPRDVFFVDEDDAGLDFGLILLDSYYVRLLLDNGVKILTEDRWVHQHSIRFDGHMMLGFPAEYTDKQASPRGDVSLAPTLITIQGVPPDFVHPKTTTYERFSGQVTLKGLKSIAGMSGGPIFGFNFDPPTKYWVVALQSSWLPDEGVVYGCPLPTLAGIISEYLEEALKRKESEEQPAES